MRLTVENQVQLTVTPSSTLILPGQPIEISVHLSNESTSNATDLGITVTGLIPTLPFQNMTLIDEVNCQPTLLPINLNDGMFQLSVASLAAAEVCTVTLAGTLPTSAAPGATPVTLSGEYALDGVKRTVNLDSFELITPQVPKFRHEFSTIQGTNDWKVSYIIDNSSASNDVAPTTLTEIAFSHDLGAVIGGLMGTFSGASDGCGNGVIVIDGSTISANIPSILSNDICEITVALTLPSAETFGDFESTTSTLALTLDTNQVEVEASQASLMLNGLEITATPTRQTIRSGGTIDYDYNHQSLSTAAASLAIVQFSLNPEFDELTAPALGAGPIPRSRQLVPFWSYRTARSPPILAVRLRSLFKHQRVFSQESTARQAPQ